MSKSWIMCIVATINIHHNVLQIYLRTAFYYIMIILQSKFVTIWFILRHNSILPELISSSIQHDLAHIQAKLEVCLDRIILHYSYSFNIVISLNMKQTHKVQLYLSNATKHMRPHNNQNIE